MRPRINPIEALVLLPRQTEPQERLASWRQTIAALGHAVRVTGPPPLDALDVADVSRAVEAALATGLADDLGFIAPGPAAVALYELMAALPQGRLRRELARRVFTRLYEGTATTFAAVATRMALGSARALDTTTLRARVSLVFDLPIGTAVNVDALALTLLSRRELLERWVVRAASGSLPARRLAAKLLEHAAREAVMRTQQGDPQTRDLLSEGVVREPFLQLLADREPLVWRHAAVARGLLSTVDPRLADQLDQSLDPSLSPTEWRRAAVSFVAQCAITPHDSLPQCRALLVSDILVRDPGMAATMVWGLPRVIESEPDTAEALLDELADTRRADVAEATATLLRDVASPAFGMRAAATLRAVLSHRLSSETEAQRVMTERALRSLDRERSEEDSLSDLARRALTAYEAQGARAAHEVAVQAVAAAERALHRMEVFGRLGDPVLPELLGVLDELDANVLERTRLWDMLLLARKPGEVEAPLPELERVYDRLGGWLLGTERPSDEPSSGELLLEHRRLRCLLHLIDAETAQRSDGEETGQRVKERVRYALRVLLEKCAAGVAPSTMRILYASLARTFDAAVREGVAEPSELFLLLLRHVSDRSSCEAVAEASTNPDISEALTAYAKFLNVAAPRDAMDSIADLDVGSLGLFQPDDESSTAARFVALSRGIASGGSYRGEALRQVVLRLGRTLEAIASARGLTELVETSGGEPLVELLSSTQDLRHLMQRASRRVIEDDAGSAIAVVTEVAPLPALVERAVTAGVPGNPLQMSMAIGEIVADLPEPLADAIRRVISRIERLPVECNSDVFAIPLEKRRTTLPDWLLPRRTLGAFYVVRALGSGGTSSVFLARRNEERNEARAESFALKVPEYDPTTARSLSEQEFLQLFKEEAGALLSLPAHPNLAKFVTFDLAARPKPILVMELIKGLSLERLIRSRALDVARAFALLDGVLQGLEAMHGAAVGHLDIKPSNVILRDNQTPVLVDFGLSGRQLRPGCGTLEYCAPEILGVVPDGCHPEPMAADLYAFACMAFELLTADSLFQGEDETSLMSAHLSHDGWPARLRQLALVPDYQELAIVLAACLRRDPRDRPTTTELRPALAQVGRALTHATWPLRAAELRVTA